MLLYSAVLLLITCSNMAISWYNASQLRKLLPPAPRKYSYVGDDYPAQLAIPTLPWIAHAWLDGEPQLSLFSDDDWGALFPTDGFTDHGAENRTFQVAIIHQLHCLDVIRVGYLTNTTGTLHHIEHCLRYLAQAVLCSADTTLEEDLVGERYLHVATGVGSLHRCRDLRPLVRYLAENPTEAWLVGQGYAQVE